ncbi:class I SAM-dependent methyltransferase [Lederbergia galactosidilytica]|uniref:16S rRNA methyltransferase n=1 Tax=Lederbergia galactosidilytica TaxID=217031 RepID=A0A178A8D8_9BACI|nr:class I SAM-dependent methyltransferase [Lederbergia galactosidilytica]KRG14278.1 16S rRNA methyltransferase [Virgibacillus soli]MBP1914347.1 16S rRNA (guanine1207-N2)-methyltransferase [Lederbergia galactosidilytica]OAK75690.1 16S rRNA methyltransferase [Lederbergia galactosidilytica]
MVDHYFSRQPEITSNPIYWDTTLRNHLLHFKTDQGVFSKKEVDFGSRFLIETFQTPMEGMVLDIGCGYGPIGLTLAKEYPDRQIHMVDINQRALELAKENAEINEVHNVNIYESDGLSNVKEASFAAILTNPPIRAGKQIVHRILEDSFQHLKVDGELWVVIQKKQGAPSAKAKLEELFHHVEIQAKRKGYYILKARK